MEIFDNKIKQVEQLQFGIDYSYIIAGSRRSGKTILLKNILYELLNQFDYNFIILISDTALIEQNNSWDWIDKQRIFETDQVDIILQKVFTYMKEKRKQQQQIYGMIILDDVQLHQQYPNLIKLFSQGRHYNLCSLVSVQYPAGLLCPSVRSNVDFLFCTRMNQNGLQKVYQCMNDSRINKKQFYKLVEDNSHNHNFVAYNNIDKQLIIVHADVIDLEKV